MKRKSAIFAILIFVVAALACCFLFGCGESNSEGPPYTPPISTPPKVKEAEYKYTVIEGKARIDHYVSGTYVDKVLEIPSELGGYVVTEIGERAFGAAIRSEEVVIPDTVEHVGERAFRFADMKHVTIPSSVKTIGKQAFFGCIYLKSVTFSDGLESIGENAFGNCIELTEADLSKNLGLTELRGTFTDSYKLSDLKLPSSITTISDDALGNTGIESFHVFEGLKFGYSMLTTCRKLKEITVDEKHEDYTAIDGVLFDKVLRSLLVYPMKKPEQSYTVPSGVKQVGYMAINKAENLTSIDLNDVEIVDARGLANNVNLAAIAGEKVRSLRDDSLSGTKWLEQQDGEFVALGEVLIKYNGNGKEVDLSGYYSITGRAFYGNDSLEKVFMGSKMHNISQYAFAECSKLKEVYFNEVSTMPYIATGVFDGNAPDRKIYISAALERYFRANSYWKQYEDSFVIYG